MAIFDSLTDAVENVLDVAEGSFDFLAGEDGPSKRQVSKLVADGLTVAAIAHGFGVAEDVVYSLLAD